LGNISRIALNFIVFVTVVGVLVYMAEVRKRRATSAMVSLSSNFFD